MLESKLESIFLRKKSIFYFLKIKKSFTQFTIFYLTDYKYIRLKSKLQYQIGSQIHFASYFSIVLHKTLCIYDRIMRETEFLMFFVPSHI